MSDLRHEGSIDILLSNGCVPPLPQALLAYDSRRYYIH